MSPEGWAALSAIPVSLATLGGSIYTARAGRRTRGQERRDDFAAITSRMDKEVTRLERRVEEQETETAEQRAQIMTQEYTIRYLVAWVRQLVAAVRAGGQEPPVAPEPVPEAIRAALHDLGV